MQKWNRNLFALALGCLFLSGAAGLIYEIVWARYLALFLGHTSYAVVAVLAAFMGGLALGNAWLGRVADRVQKPLLFYAWLELGIVAYALLFPHYYEICHDAYIFLARLGYFHGRTLFLLKFLFSLASILLPTLLMGGTLPALTRFVTGSLGELRQTVSALYFINSAGAVVGCVAADFWSIPRLGLEETVLLAAMLNFLAGLSALIVGFRSRSLASAAVANAAAQTGPGVMIFTTGEIKWVIAAAGLSGFVAMLYEVAWTRMLALALGSSTHAFSLMLITFIAGIATGAWLIHRWKIAGSLLRAFAWAEILLAGTVAISMFFYDLLPYWFVKAGSLLIRRGEAYPLYEALQGAICFSVMFIPATCLGATLPLASRIATATLDEAGRMVGRVFAVNTLGTVLGAVVTGLFLLPTAGLARTFTLGIVLNAAIGVVILGRERRAAQAGNSSERWAHLGWALLGALALFCFSGWWFDRTWQAAFSSGLWRSRQLPSSQAAYLAEMRQEQLKYYRDGAGATVSINHWMTAKGEQLALKVNGKVDASTAGLDVSTQLLLGHVPMFLRTGAERVLVIGLGSGMTCAAVGAHPTVKQIDAVEISPEVAEAIKLFAPYNGGIFGDPRFHLIVEDAKSHLQISAARYDAIISEPSNPWMAGVAAVFSQEYYESCRDRLDDRGVMVQWVQIYETSEAAFQIVLATFSSVFPQVSVWQSAQADLLLVGSKQPLKPDLAALEKEFQIPKVKADLDRIDLTRLPVLLSREVISANNARFLVGDGARIHSDFYPVLEYVAQRAFFVGEEAAGWQRLDENLSPRASTLLAAYVQSHPLTEADFKAFGSFFLATHLPPPRLLQTILHRWKQLNPASTLPLQLEAQLSDHRLFSELETMSMSAQRDLVRSSAERDPELLQRYERLLLASYRAQRSIFNIPPDTELRSVIELLLQKDPANQRVYHLHLAELSWDHGDDAACLRDARLGFDPDTAARGPLNFRLDPQAPPLVLALMLEIYWRAGKIDRAAELAREVAANGYLKPGATSPLLEMSYRKISAAVAQSSAAGGAVKP